MEKEHFKGRPIPDSVAIVAMGFSRLDYGTAATSIGGYRALADEVWAINKMGGVIFHDIVWRIDDLMENRELMYPEYLRWLKTHPFIVTSTAYPDEFPGSVEYPLEEVVNDIGIPYLNTTPAYALAYAIYLGVKKISIYGCDYTYPNQAMAEQGRGCFELLMGIAFSRKTQLVIGKHASLLDQCIPIEERFYGYKKGSVSAWNDNGKLIITRNSAPERVSSKDAEKETLT